MQDQGRLTEWNDQRGFGFVTPLAGGSKVFVHVSEFPRDLRRPMVTDLVTYTVGRDGGGRIRAQQVAFLGPAHARHEEEARSLNAVEFAVPAIFAVALVALTAIRSIPAVVLGFYLLVSVIAFAMYWQDKVAATHGRWRTSEAALIGVAAIGGWPGAFIARHVFRHKTRKQPFRTYFWLAVGANCALLAVMVFELGLTAA